MCLRAGVRYSAEDVDSGLHDTRRGRLAFPYGLTVVARLSWSDTVSEPTFGYTSAERDGLRVMKVVSGKNVNGHSLPDTNASSVTERSAALSRCLPDGVAVWNVPVFARGWVSAELLEEVLMHTNTPQSKRPSGSGCNCYCMERDQAVRYVRTFGQIFNDLGPMIASLQAEIAAMPSPSFEAVSTLARYKDLRREIAREVAKFGQFVDTDMTANMQQVIALGLQHGEQMTLAGLPEPLAAAIRAQWNELPVDAVRALMGFLSPGSPLHDALRDQLGAAVADGVEKALLRGIALGQNPPGSS